MTNAHARICMADCLGISKGNSGHIASEVLLIILFSCQRQKKGNISLTVKHTNK